jgi:hypothetical protein
MSKPKPRSPRKPPAGSIAKLDHMVDHSITRRKNFTTVKPRSPTNEGLFEMIDSRLARLMARSSELDARLESLEQTAPAKKSPSSSRPPPAPRRQPESPLPLDEDDALVHLYEAVQALAQQVADVRSEQEILRVQVEKLHSYVVSGDT